MTPNDRVGLMLLLVYGAPLMLLGIALVWISWRGLK